MEKGGFIINLFSNTLEILAIMTDTYLERDNYNSAIPVYSNFNEERKKLKEWYESHKKEEEQKEMYNLPVNK